MPSRPIPPDLLPWALTALGYSPGDDIPKHAVSLVAGDASNRRYFRLDCAGERYILADAPPQTEKNAEFVAIGQVLSDAQVRVPKILAADTQRGFLLLEDLGDRTLLAYLNGESVDAWYRKSGLILQKMAAIDLGRVAVPSYDAAILDEELSRFSAWFVEDLLDYPLSVSEKAMIADLNALLVDSALEQPRVLVHRDFHSRNLMLVENDELAVIDFQDAVAGPVTYDIASLFKDCYICWPEQQVAKWVLEYKQVLEGAGRLSGASDQQFSQWFDWMALQRHIKVLGTFARLHLRDGKDAYLRDLPVVLDYVRESLDKYADQAPPFAAFSRWFDEALAPAIASQPWSTRH